MVTSLIILSLATMPGQAAKEQAKSRRHAFNIGERISPDGKWVARLRLGEAEVTELTMVRKGDQGSRPVLKERDVSSAIWDPALPARLIYGASGLYGRGKLACWAPGAGLRHLIEVKNPSNEAFKVLWIDLKTRRMKYLWKKADAVNQTYKPRFLDLDRGLHRHAPGQPTRDLKVNPGPSAPSPEGNLKLPASRSQR